MQKAAVVTEYCEDPAKGLNIQAIDVLQPEDDEIIIEVKACGVNYPDLLLVRGKYQFQPEFPFSPGGEVSGVVLKIGSDVKADGQYKVGDRVIAMTGWGGFATQIRARADQCIPMPDGLSFETASAFIMTYGTTLYALRNRGKLQRGETLVVLGAAGGVGTAAIEIGKKILGARVIACASSESKLELCKKLGADEVINYSKCKNIKNEIRDLGGADVIYDPVGGSLAESSLRAMNWNGRYLVIGFAAGTIPKIPLNLPLLKSVSIVGVFWGAWRMNDINQSNEQISEIANHIRNGALNPTITKRYSLENAGQCLSDFSKRKVSGKVIISMENTSKL